MRTLDFATPDLSDNHPEAPVLPFQWLRLGQRQCFAGPISTVACFEDNSRVAEAVAEPGDGRVLLVDGQGSLDCSLLGDKLAQKASDNGWAGVVVIGAVRDVEIIDRIEIGVYALGSCPKKTEKRGVGDRDITLAWHSVVVLPGQWLYADRNGVLISAEAIHR